MGIKHVNLSKNRLGAERRNNEGSLMKVIKYENANNILVEFNSGNIVKTRWKEFSIGEVKNPYEKSIYGVGYIGEGDYKSNNSKIKNLQYNTWISMLNRCYNEKFKEKHSTYENSIVIDEWHNFQNFAKWFDDNYYQVDEERMNLDKDILIKRNKLYSPATCVFVPQKVNLLIVKNEAKRGHLPLGVHFEKQTSKYKAQCKIGNGRSKNLGRYDSPEKAFEAYKEFKEKHIKEIAEIYKDKIPNKLYKALLRYKVDIND